MIEKKFLKDLTPVEWQACYRANYGAGGYMRHTLMENRDNPDAFALMIWNGPHDTFKNMQGWALCTPVTTYGYIGTSYYAAKKAKYTVQFWVKRQYRKQGLGHALMQEVKKDDKRPHVFPHDEASGEFFSAYDVTSSRVERTWMRKKPRVA